MEWALVFFLFCFGYYCGYVHGSLEGWEEPMKDSLRLRDDARDARGYWPGKEVGIPYLITTPEDNERLNQYFLAKMKAGGYTANATTKPFPAPVFPLWCGCTLTQSCGRRRCALTPPSE